MTQLEIRGIVRDTFPRVDEETLDLFLERSSYQQYAKGVKLFEEGKRHHYFYLLLDGCVKSHYLKDGKDVCLWFAFEQEIIASIRAFEGDVSNETVELMEDSKFIRFKVESMKELASTNLAVSRLLLEMAIDHSLFLEDRLFQLQFMSSKERYDALLKSAPEAVQKLSVTDIASFLGVSRETLSRIRGQK